MQNQARNSILVTGAEGFLGRAVTLLLERLGQPVIALDSIVPRSVSDSESTIKVACDIRNHARMERIFEEHGLGAIIHLAAMLPTAAQRDPVLATQVNVEGSLNLLELATRFGVRRFIFGSSLSVYGAYPADHVVSEQDRTAPGDVYGAAKLYVERMGAAFASLPGMDFVSLRLGRVVGPGAHSTTSAWRSEIFELLQTDRPAEIVIPYIRSERVLLLHVEDAAKALVTLLQPSPLAHATYNAPCESWMVDDLSNQLQALNPHLRITLGDKHAEGNPRLVDFSRFRSEFEFAAVPVTERLRVAAGM